MTDFKSKKDNDASTCSGMVIRDGESRGYAGSNPAALALTLTTPLFEHVWAFLGMQALKRLFGPFCDEYEAGCPSCEAKKLCVAMKDICHG